MAADRGPGVPSEAELEQMLVQMREAPAEQVLVEVVNVLLQAAQVKLGRPDARLLIDAVAAVAQAAAGRADAALLGQVGEAVTQLRLAQVEAEGDAQAPAGTSGTPSNPVPGASAAPAGRPAGPAPGPTAGTPPEAPPAGSRLWVPGR